MGDIVNNVVEVSTFGLVDDVTGVEAGREAALQAGNLQYDAAMAAEQGINDRFQQSLDLINPQIQAGNRAREQQMRLLGLDGAAAQQQAYDSMIESPAQKFIRERAQKNLLQNAAALGGIGGGNVRTALVEQGAGFAMQDIDNQFNRLAGLSGSGGQAAYGAGQMANQAGANAGNAIMAGGRAHAGGILGANQATQQANQQVMQLGGMALGALTGGATLPVTSGMSGGQSFLNPVSANIPSLTLF